MNSYIEGYERPRFPYQRQEAERLVEEFDAQATVTNGIVRWNSNSAVPPADILEFWQYLGKPFDYAASASARETDLEAFPTQYRQDAHPLGQEELAEMRAAFGSDVTVTNALTGHRTRL